MPSSIEWLVMCIWSNKALLQSFMILPSHIKYSFRPKIRKYKKDKANKQKYSQLMCSEGKYRLTFLWQECAVVSSAGQLNDSHQWWPIINHTYLLFEPKPSVCSPTNLPLLLHLKSSLWSWCCHSPSPPCYGHPPPTAGHLLLLIQVKAQWSGAVILHEQSMRDWSFGCRTTFLKFLKFHHPFPSPSRTSRDVGGNLLLCR